jgi:hypothetical protein
MPATQVHHLTYRRWRREREFDLVSICDACHEKEHVRAPQTEATPTIACCMCGTEHLAYEQIGAGIYLAWWVMAQDKVGAERVIDVGLYCNGRGLCRDQRTKQIEDQAPKDIFPWQYVSLNDMPASRYYGPWAWVEMREMVRDYKWTDETLAKLLQSLSRLSELAPTHPVPEYEWYGMDPDHWEYLQEAKAESDSEDE